MRRGQNWEQEKTALRGVGGRPTTAGKWSPEPRPSRSPCMPLTGATGEVGGSFLTQGGQRMEVCEEEESGQGRAAGRAAVGNWKETEKRDVLWWQQVVAAGVCRPRPLLDLTSPPTLPILALPPPPPQAPPLPAPHVRWSPRHSPNPTHTSEAAPGSQLRISVNPTHPRGSQEYKKAARARNGGTMSRPAGRAELDR